MRNLRDTVCVTSVLLSGILAPTAAASLYMSSLSSSTWSSTTSEFRCELIHVVDGFGDVRFIDSRETGLQLRFQPKGSYAVPSSWLAESVPAFWKTDDAPQYLGHFTTKNPWSIPNPSPIQRALQQGQSIVLSSGGLRVGLHHQGYAKAADAFHQCSKQRIRDSFASLAKKTLYYDPIKGLNHDALQTLRTMARYIRADNNVLGVLVDAHADPASFEVDAQLSERAAGWVKEALLAAGVSDDKITVRAHGDTYPVSRGSTSSSNAKNRRITLRLENQASRDAMARKIAFHQQKKIAEAAKLAQQEAVDATPIENDPSITPVTPQNIEDWVENMHPTHVAPLNYVN